MKWRYLGHLQLLSRAVAAMAEMEVSPQEEMANPQGMKVFAVEKLGLPEDLCLFLLCVECNHRRHSYLCRIGRLSGVRYSGRPRERLCASGLRFPEVSAQVRIANSCTSRIPSSHRRFHYAQNRLSVRRGRSRTAAESLCGLDVNQSLPQRTKCIPLTAHKASELTELPAATYVGVK